MNCYNMMFSLSVHFAFSSSLKQGPTPFRRSVTRLFHDVIDSLLMDVVGMRSERWDRG